MYKKFFCNFYILANGILFKKIVHFCPDFVGGLCTYQINNRGRINNIVYLISQIYFFLLFYILYSIIILTFALL